MTQRSLAVLAIFNVVLIAAIALTFGAVPPQAQAQPLGGGGGSYLMIAGNTEQRQQQQVIYVLQVNTGRVAGFLLNSGNGEVTFIRGREIAEDLQDNNDGGRR